MNLSEKEKILKLNIDKKLEQSKLIIREAMESFQIDNLAVAITGGKDSTTNLWLFKQVCEEMDYKLPLCVFIDEGDVFDEIKDFVEHIKKLWSFEMIYLRNEDVFSCAKNIGDIIQISSLNEANQNAILEMNLTESQFPFIPDSPICNHLMKTIPLRDFIVNHHIKALSTAIRWDEIEAREIEDYFSARSNPPHTRIHPILHLTERDIWIAIFKYDIPFNTLYRLGYRSLGARCATHKISDIPAWMQDLDNTPERMGRGREKETVMEQLRLLGYM
jgi:phosphoadenosine phosphosulfate reductase